MDICKEEELISSAGQPTGLNTESTCITASRYAKCMVLSLPCNGCKCCGLGSMIVSALFLVLLSSLRGFVQHLLLPQRCCQYLTSAPCSAHPWRNRVLLYTTWTPVSTCVHCQPQVQAQVPHRQLQLKFWGAIDSQLTHPFLIVQGHK